MCVLSRSPRCCPSGQRLARFAALHKRLQFPELGLPKLLTCAPLGGTSSPGPQGTSLWESGLRVAAPLAVAAAAAASDRQSFVLD